MTRGGPVHVDRGRPRSRQRRDLTHHENDGFTLLELLMTLVLIPIVIAALAAGLIAVFSTQTSVTTRVQDSGDAQVVSANFGPDVQSASVLTLESTPACGSGTQLLGLESNLNTSTGQYETAVSYVLQQQGSTYVLVRNDCTSGASSSPTISQIIAFNVSSTLGDPTFTPSSEGSAAASAWISAQLVQKVAFKVTEPEQGSTYTYWLTGVPAAASRPNTGGSPIQNNTTTTCGFASTENGTVSNGTYAQTLCFVDFSSYNATEAAYPSCQTFIAAIPGGDTLSFCMSESGNEPMEASALPTYPEAFLGNVLTNGSSTLPFYTALGCSSSTSPTTGSGGATPSCIEPAMYQTDTNVGPSNTLEFTNISVTTATGAAATGWEWVSADAETTDSNEYITWTSNQDLSILPDSSTSAYGDTCNNEPNWNGPQGAGTTTMTCQSGSQETSATKTGTPLVEAPQPTTMTITMKGAGLEAIAVGLLLP